MNAKRNNAGNVSVKVNYARKLVYFLFLLSFLLSMNLWIGWEERKEPMNKVIGLVAFCIIIGKHIPLDLSRKNILVFILLSISTLLAGYNLSIYMPFQFLLYFVIICLNDADKTHCLDFITKWYGYLMVPCMAVYLLLTVMDLPSLGNIRAADNDWAALSGYGYCKNFIFYMQSPFYEGRFNGPFLEPGHLGMMSAFLLFANRFDFKKKGMWFIFMTLLLTLSLAGYVLLFAGFLFHLYNQGKITVKHVFLYSLVFLAVYLFGMYYNNGDNVLYEKIFSRLEPDDEKGFSGNNRVFGLIDVYYAALWRDTDLLLWGYPRETMEWLADNGSRGTGYVMSMCKYGLIGTISPLLFYFVYVMMSRNRKFAMLCFIFVVLMFWQRSYPFWTSWMICFIYGIISEERSKQILK